MISTTPPPSPPFLALIGNPRVVLRKILKEQEQV